MIEITDKLLNLALMPFTWNSILTYFPMASLLLGVLFAFISRLMGR